MADLVAAAGKGDCAEVKNLLDSGADADSPIINGCTPLMYAAYNDHQDVVRLLLDRGAKIDLPNDDGFTALFFAVSGGRRDTVELFLDRGADPENKIDGRSEEIKEVFRRVREERRVQEERRQRLIKAAANVYSVLKKCR